ncbi:hypothetical protein D915_001921 [Fasciola hepatica]|uniref:Uncharacterized protein n=1 Tax=Fasciola hepatica TaxID=6192 RepID=A0A2H1CQG1_FASHE|nr:hypothetical protein D915_001921 [Fasciola hepatica]
MMAFVTTNPQPTTRWFPNHANTPELSQEFCRPCEPCRPIVHAGNPTHRDERASAQGKEHIITQSAAHLNYYDTVRSPIVTLHPISDAHCATPQPSRTRSQRLDHSTEPIQHRSMIELDERRENCYPILNCVSPIQTPTQFRWIRHRTTSSLDVARSPGRTPPSGFMRFTIQDLMQQESCVGSVNYMVDQPSKLVRIECRKPGCRCVLKNEPALALKIVSGVTLVQGRWLLPSKSGPKSPLNLTIYNPNAGSKSRNGLPFSFTDASADVSPVVLTSCCPSWFELISRPSSRDSPHVQCPEVPIWSSGKALWRAKPRFFLLRKPVQCLVGAVNQPLTTSVADVYKPDAAGCNLDASNTITLRAGTVLELLDCRACRLMQHDSSGTTSNASVHLGAGLLSRHRGKTLPMLQCAIVGAKALVPVASVATDLSMKDGLQWLADGPRLVYLSLDSKSISCSPVATHNTQQSDCRQNIVPLKSFNTCPSSVGVHSLFSLLSASKLPALVRPLTGLRPNEWFPLEKADCRFVSPWEFSSVADTPLLLLDMCYHGDLIFLEPLTDCVDPMHHDDSRNLVGQSRSSSTSRFFVVTPDMLAQHNFFLADAATTVQYTNPLELHACRVAHFLAACHPAQGLAYLMKHLEDISFALDTGPSHIPLTRTLGPVSSSVKYCPIQSVLLSISAAAALATDDLDELGSWERTSMEQLSQPDLTGNLTLPWGASSLNSIHRYQSSGCLIGAKSRANSSLSSSFIASETDQMNALCDEIEDIYFYVRNGRFPAQSRSMTSLVHHVTPVGRSHRPLPQTSAPISPQADEMSPNESHHQRASYKRGFSRGRYTTVETGGINKESQPQQQQQQPVMSFIKRPQKSPQFYMPRSLADIQQIPVLAASPEHAVDVGTLMSPKNRMNRSSGVHPTQPELTDGLPKENLVRVFQSPAHDSGVDIGVHRSFSNNERQVCQPTYPGKVYTNTRVLTMSKIVNNSNQDNSHTTMSQSQITTSQPALNSDHVSYRHRKRSTDSASAFRLPVPRAAVDCVDYTDSANGQPVTERNNSSSCRQNAKNNGTYLVNPGVPIYGGQSFGSDSQYSGAARFPDDTQSTKSPLRVIDLRHTDSRSLGQLQNSRVLSSSTTVVSHSVSCVPTNSPSVTAGATRSYCLCQPPTHSHSPAVPLNAPAVRLPVNPTAVYSSAEAMRPDRRTSSAQPAVRCHPPTFFMMVNPGSVEDDGRPSGWTAIDSNTGYMNSISQPPAPFTNTIPLYATVTTNTVTRHTKHRTEMTNSSPDTGIGGESGVEIPCTLVLSHSYDTNTSWPPTDASDRTSRGGLHYSNQTGSATRLGGRIKQIYQI